MLDKSAHRIALGKLLRSKRKTAGMNWRDVSDFVGISMESVGRTERGTRSVSTWELMRFAKLFDTHPLEQLMNAVPTEAVPNTLPCADPKF